MSDATLEKRNDNASEKYDPTILKDMLPVYYRRLFPHKPFYKWLSYGLFEEGIFANREISFVLHDDIYMRYLSFESQQEMEKELCARNPIKFDIGAVMSQRPKNFRVSSEPMVPVQRELVFDIDMTDYDDVRTCCMGADVCSKCWKYMILAARILDIALREDFAFEHLLWVFSGRRGIHCWVCDDAARHLDARGRSAVAEYFQVVTYVMSGSGTNVARVTIGERMHHSVKRAYKIIEPLFEEIVLDDQNLFGTTDGIARLIQMLPDDSVRKDVEAFLKKNTNGLPSSRSVWSTFVLFANAMRTSANASNVWSRKLKYIIEEIQLAIMYPRLDIHVTKGFNHLLKAPFCIHPSTGKLCVPFKVSALADFDPDKVPTIVRLLHEINAFDKVRNEFVPEEKSRIKDYKKTSMFKGVLIFEEFLHKIESSLKAKKIDLIDQRLDF